jgi:hypothetical protein
MRPIGLAVLGACASAAALGAGPGQPGAPRLAGSSWGDGVLTFERGGWFNTVADLEVVGPRDIWGVGMNGIVHYDGNSWRLIQKVAPDSQAGSRLLTRRSSSFLLQWLTVPACQCAARLSATWAIRRKRGGPYVLQCARLEGERHAQPGSGGRCGGVDHVEERRR